MVIQALGPVGKYNANNVNITSPTNNGVIPALPKVTIQNNAQQVQSTKINSPSNSGNFFMDAKNALSNIFGNITTGAKMFASNPAQSVQTIKNTAANDINAGVSSLYHTVLSDQQGSAIHAITSFPVVHQAAQTGANIIDSIFKLPQEAITNAQSTLSGAHTAVLNNKANTGQQIINAIGQGLVDVQKAIQPIMQPTAKEDTLGGMFGTEWRGIQQGLAQQYFGDTPAIMNTFNTPLDKPVTTGGKLVHTVGDVVGQAVAFLAGGKVLKAAGLGKATMPILFATLGQTSSPASTTALQRIEKAPVDAIAGWLFGGLNASGGVAGTVKAAGQAGTIMAGNQFIDSVIQGQKGTDALKTAGTMFAIGALFHVAGTATGVLGSKLFDSQVKQGVIDMSPDQMINQVQTTNLKGTDAGVALSKMATEAQAQGKYVRVSATAAKATPLAKALNLETPNGIRFNAELVDAPSQVSGGAEETQSTGVIPAMAPVDGEVTNAPTEETPAANPIEEPNQQETSVSAGPTNTSHNTEESPTNSLTTEPVTPPVEKPVEEVPAPEKQPVVRVPAEFKSPIEESAFTKLSSDPNAITKEYIDKFSNEVNPDLALQLFEGYKGHNSGQLSRVSGAVKSLVYNKLLTTEQGKRNNTVYLSAGGSGSGKSSMVSAEAKLKDTNAIVVDTTFSHNSAEKDIKKALDKGYHVNLNYVLRHPHEAWTHGVLPRTKEEGRVISEGYFLRSHVDARKNIVSLYDKYKNDDRLSFHFYESTPEGVKQTNIDTVRAMTYNKPALAEYIKNATDKGYETGQLTKAQQKAITSDRSELERFATQPERGEKQSAGATESQYTQEVADAIDLVREALYSGDENAAQDLHNNFSQEFKDFPSFTNLQADNEKLNLENMVQLATIKKELVEDGISSNPDDPNNQLYQIAQKLADHFSRPKAKYKITGSERTYTSSDGHTLKVGGNAAQAFDRLIHATDIEGFKKNIEVLHEKFDKVFTDIYDTIKRGGIDGGDYQNFRSYYESIEGKRLSRLSINGEVLQATKNQTDNKPIQDTTGRAAIQGSSNTESTQNTEGSNAAVSNAESAVNRESKPSEPTSAENARRENELNSRNNAVSTGSEQPQGSGTVRDEVTPPDIGEPENSLNPQRGSVDFNAGIDPGLKAFFQEDIQPAFSAAQEVGKEWNALINPPKASEKAAQTANLIREAKAQIANYQTNINNQFKSFRRFYDRYSDKQNVKNIANYERTGILAREPKLTAREQQLYGVSTYSELYKKSMTESYKVLMAAYGKEPESFIENYVRRQFVFGSRADEAKGTTYLTNYMHSLSASKSPMHQRVLDMPIDEALQNMEDRGIKVKMASSNPEELRQWSLVNAQRALSYRQAWKDAEKSELVKFVRAGENIPEGWVKLADPVATVFGNPHIGITEHLDENIMNGLNEVAKNLDITHDRPVKVGGSRLGYTSRGGPVVTKFASSEAVLAHEIGHQIDFKYGLQERLVNNPETKKELRALADQRLGEDSSQGFKSYTRKGSEKMAAILEAYIHAPQLLKRVAPNTYRIFTYILENDPKLRPLTQLQTGLRTVEGNQSVYAGGAVVRGRYYADPAVARIFNNAISRGLEGSATYRGIRFIGNTLNQFQLGLSGFHFAAVGLDAGVTDFSIGLSHFIQGVKGANPSELFKGLQHTSSGAIPFYSFFKDMYRGAKLINGLKENSPEAAQFLEEKLNPAGGRLSQDRRYTTGAWNKFSRAVMSGNPIGGTLRMSLKLPSAFVEGVAHPLLGYAIPRVKLGAFMDLAELKLSRIGPQATDFERRQALVSAWTSVDNRMGQLVYDNLFWNKVGKDIAMLTVRSVGWDLGTDRELGGALVDIPNALLLGKTPKYDVTSILGKRGISDRLMWGAALVMMVAAYSALYEYLHTGHGPQELVDYFHPKNGLTDLNGNPDRVNFASYLKDVFAYAANPVQTTFDKASPLVSVIEELLTNKDYYGNLIRNPQDPTGTQLAQTGNYVLQAMFPFTIQQTLNQIKEGASPERVAEGFFGIVKAPQQVIQSPQYRAAINALNNQMGSSPGAKSPEQVAAQTLKTTARREIKNAGGDWSKSPAFHTLMQNGTLKTQLQRRNFIKGAMQPSIQRIISHLPKATRQQILNTQ